MSKIQPVLWPGSHLGLGRRAHTYKHTKALVNTFFLFLFFACEYEKTLPACCLPSSTVVVSDVVWREHFFHTLVPALLLKKKKSKTKT